MLSRVKHSAAVAAISLPFAFAAGSPLLAQTFHGAVTGSVTDPTGAAVPGAAVVLINPATDARLTFVSNKAGEFNFTELPVGTYTLTVSAPGFQSRKIDAIDVAVTKIENFPVVLAVGAETTEVEVTANGVQVDSESSALVAVIDSKAVEDIPLNGRDFVRLTKLAPGVSAFVGSVNGSRVGSINFQLDGADNVDPWLGIVASNQGGIASVPGGLIPIEAINQFSIQAAGEADQGRNAGANQNMVIKSGTNSLHGDVFYFDRNEYFAAINPFALPNSKKPLLRNHQGGFTLGGPIWKDHTFLFTAGEIQIAKTVTSISDTVVSDPWIAAATANIAKYTDPTTNAPYVPNPLSLNLYKLLFPSAGTSSPAVVNNALASGISNYNSYNGIIKLDQRFNDKETLAVRYLGTTGTQTAPTGSFYQQYFQTAPMHIHNFSIVQTSILTPRIVNTVTFATNYFLQTFNDADQNFFPQKNAGLNLGITNAVVAQGAPTISITGFDITGATQPSGRTDVTGHVTDNFHWTLGRHEMKLGGEYRHSNVNQLYFSSSRGTFTFDGSRGPWGGAGTPLSDLSDFLIGATTNSSGARLLQGNAQRVWTFNTEDAWAQDDFRVTRNLTLNLGVRYTIPGVIQAAANDIYQFVPASGGGAAGFQQGYYPEYYGGVAPRLGFSYAPFGDQLTVVRGSYGIFYDFPAMSSWITGTTTNGGAAYAQNNPAGPDAAVIFNQNNVRWASNVNPFAASVAPQVGAFGVNQNFKMPRANVVSFGVEQQLAKNTLFSVGYVGTFAQHLEVLYNINQPVANGTTVAASHAGTPTRYPYQATSYANENPAFAGQQLLAINQLNFEAASNYHSLQTTLRQANWKGLAGTFNYTWSKALDDASTNTTPMNSYNLHQDYGLSTFDSRNSLNGYLVYTMPKFTSFASKLTQGYQVDALAFYSSGIPLSPQYSTNVDGTGELKDRPNYTGVSPFVNGVQLNQTTATGRNYRYLQNLVSHPSFTCPGAVSTSPTNPAVCPTTATGVYGNEKRDNFTGPNFRSVDVSLIKHTPVTEHVMSELRVEMFNVFNFNNFAAPTVTATSGSFGIISNTRNGVNAPGIGVGEPFNIQFAAKLTF